MRDLELKNVMKFNNKEYLVSTISMNVRHSWFQDDTKKIVYETMVFEINNEEVDYLKPIFTERYNMKEEAIAEHSSIIKNPKAFFIL